MMYGSWDIERGGQTFFFILDNSLSFYPLKTWKIKILKKKKCLEILSFYTSVIKFMIICYSVLDIWHVIDEIVIFRSGLFFALLLPNSLKNKNLKKNKTPGHTIILYKCTKNYDHVLYHTWYMVWDGCDYYFSCWGVFALLPPNSPKNQSFQKMKKTTGDIIILHAITKNYE